MKYSRKFLVILGLFLALGLSACDPLSMPYLSANRVFVMEETPYLYLLVLKSMGLGSERYKVEDFLFVSHDQGLTWQMSVTDPAGLTREIADPPNAQVTNCVPGDATTCYRIMGQEQVEMSTDGGTTWKVDWKMPLGRKEYQQRNPELAPFLRVVPDTIPYDLQILAEQGKHTVIVAMGNQGVLVKTIAGAWERRGIPSVLPEPMLATPLPFYAASIAEAVGALDRETNLSVLLMFAQFLLFFLFSWGTIRKNFTASHRGEMAWSCLPVILASAGFFTFIVLLIIPIFVPSLFSSPMVEILYGIDPLFAACLLPVAGLLLSWLLLAFLSPDRKLGLGVALLSFGFTILFGLSIYSPFLLWAYGVIPLYKIALILAIVLGGVTALSGWLYLRRYLGKFRISEPLAPSLPAE